jgi:hemerythrin superfamily protein
MDAITLLKNDHRSVQRLFKRFEAAGSGAAVEKREIVDRIIEELSIHAAIEEQVFYPVARATVPGTEDLALESLEEHHIVKWTLAELEAMPADDERFDAKVTVLIESVRHHVGEEEHDFFPKVRAELGRHALSDLGDALEHARKTAPTHPHPRGADTPPANLVTGTAAGVVDRVGDTMSGVAQGGVSAVGDLIAVVLGRKKPRVSPTGSRRARETATKVRTGASDATDSALQASKRTARNAQSTSRAAARKTKRTATAAGQGARATTHSAERGAAGTAKAAKAGAKATSTSARKSATRTTTTAKRAATTTGRTARRGGKQAATTAKRSATKVSAAGRG